MLGSAIDSARGHSKLGPNRGTSRFWELQKKFSPRLRYPVPRAVLRSPSATCATSFGLARAFSFLCCRSLSRFSEALTTLFAPSHTKTVEERLWRRFRLSCGRRGGTTWPWGARLPWRDPAREAVRSLWPGFRPARSARISQRTRRVARPFTAGARGRADLLRRMPSDDFVNPTMRSSIAHLLAV